MKLIGSLFIFIMATVTVIAQDSVINRQYNYPNNIIFVEVAGNSYLFGSLNYERVLIKLKIFYLDGRIGFGYGNFSQTSILSAPIGFNGILQIYQAFAWECGIGLSLMQVRRTNASPRNSLLESEQIPALVMSTGLRIQDKDGFLFRIDFTPFFNLNHDGQLFPPNKFAPWVGLSLGYRIGKRG